MTRAVLSALLCLPLLGGCGLIAHNLEQATLDDCETWRPGCPIVIDFTHGGSSGAVPAAGPAGAASVAPIGSGGPAPPAQIPADSLSVPQSETTGAALAAQVDARPGGEPLSLPPPAQPSPLPRSHSPIPGLTPPAVYPGPSGVGIGSPGVPYR